MDERLQKMEEILAFNDKNGIVENGIEEEEKSDSQQWIHYAHTF